MRQLCRRDRLHLVARNVQTPQARQPCEGVRREIRRGEAASSEAEALEHLQALEGEGPHGRDLLVEVQPQRAEGLQRREGVVGRKFFEPVSLELKREETGQSGEDRRIRNGLDPVAAKVKMLELKNEMTEV